MKCLFSLHLLFIIFNESANAAMTEKQLTAAVKLVRNVCQTKTKATNDDIEKMHNGDWNVDRTAMCYMQCAFTRNRLMTKENTLDYEYAVNLAKKSLPEGRKVAALTSIDECKDSAKTVDDECVAAYELANCMYQSNPSVIITFCHELYYMKN